MWPPLLRFDADTSACTKCGHTKMQHRISSALMLLRHPIDGQSVFNDPTLPALGVQAPGLRPSKVGFFA